MNTSCLTLTNSTVTFSIGFNSSYIMSACVRAMCVSIWEFYTNIRSTTVNHTTNAEATLLKDKLKGEFCYVEIQKGSVVSIHYSPNENGDAVNVKKGITGAF